MIADPYQLFVVFLGMVLLAVVLDKKYAVARKISPVIMILFLGGLLSNVGLITHQSPFYDALIGFTVPFAVCLILFTVNLQDLKRVGAPLLVAFAIACAGTFVAALIAGWLLNPYLTEILGGDAWKLAGPFTGTYVGGSLNFFALWEGLGIGNPDLFAAANGVDVLTIFPLFAIWILVPDLLGRRYPVGRIWRPADRPAEEEETTPSAPALRIPHLVGLSFAAAVVILLSNLIKDYWIARILPDLPTILIVTTLALILAQCRFMGRLQGARELGNVAFYLFFCAVGAMMDLYTAITLSPILFVYVMLMIVVHMVVVYGLGRLLRLDVRILTIASAAAKTGPATVLALANTKDWKTLALPGVAVGLLGYAVGNYFGFAAAYVMKFLLGM